MRLFVGLGNPGEEYKSNRHNAGYLLVEVLSKRHLPKGFILKKSQSLMNASGDFVKKLVAQYSLNTSDLWIIHDDLDIPLGAFKIQKGKGPKVHNGILSIEEKLGTDDFWRVRIGIDNRSSQDKIPGERYVLEDFTPEERKILEGTIEEICKKLVTL